MAQKKLITIEKLGTYDSEIKKVIKSGDEKTLTSAKQYADSLSDQYDTAGSAATVQQNANKYTDDEIAKVEAKVQTAQTQADKGVTDAAAADGKAVKAQSDVDTLKTYVGTFESAKAKDVIGYIDEKTEHIASDSEIAELKDRVTQAESDIDALEADHLVAADKTELEGKIKTAQDAAKTAQQHSEGVASNLATAKSSLETADNEQKNRLTVLEEKITGLSGAMHFKGVVELLPVDVADYEEGDVIIVGEKEYVFNGTEFKEFGDVSAEGKRISTLETNMTEAQGDITKAQQDIVNNASAIAKKAEQTSLDEEVANRESADTALSGRIKTLEDTVGESGSVAEDINKAKTEAINTAAADATTKADKALSDAKTYTNEEVNKDRARLDALETDIHTHDNKVLLDTYDQTNDNLKDAVSKKHAHTNATVLDGIQADNVSTWNTVTNKADNSALTDEVNRATAREDEIAAAVADMVEASEEEILALFNE